MSHRRLKSRHPGPLPPPRRLLRLGLPARRALPVLAALPLLALLAACHPSTNAGRYDVIAVDRGDVLEHVTATGSLSALVSVDVGSQVSGKVSRLFADYNSPVKKGQLV
ncbi:MAG TPA: hypothetical protein VMB48_00365, partial [Steroidobacteraceae bacterium]|nr:hypothetical protein [Steroidobacteraceae bacterium]